MKTSTKWITSILFPVLMAVAISCSSKKDDTSNDVSAEAASITNVTPETTVAPTPTPTPTSSVTPGSTGSVSQGAAWGPYYGWPYFNWTGGNCTSALPTNYQTFNYPYFPSYHQNWNRPYYFTAVTTLYRQYLAQDPDLVGTHFWIREIVAGRPYSKIREDFVTQAATLGDPTKVQDVIGLFRVLFGRLPDRGSLQYWVGQLNSGVTLTVAAQQLQASSAFSFYGARYYVRSIDDIYRAVASRYGTYEEYVRWVTSVRTGTGISSVLTSIRTEQAAVGGIPAENCIAAHRVIRGTLPTQAEITRCIAFGDNTTVVAPSTYNTALQSYIQSLMTY